MEDKPRAGFEFHFVRFHGVHEVGSERCPHQGSLESEHPQFPIDPLLTRPLGLTTCPPTTSYITFYMFTILRLERSGTGPQTHLRCNSVLSLI